MFRLKSLTKGAVALSLALAVGWSLLACASLCTLESTIHDSQASTCEAIAEANSDGVKPVEDCCLCPDISSPAGATQQRETGEQIVVLKARVLPALINIEPNSNALQSIDSLPDDSPPKINAPPLFVRLRSFRI